MQHDSTLSALLKAKFPDQEFSADAMDEIRTLLSGFLVRSQGKAYNLTKNQKISQISMQRQLRYTSKRKRNKVKK